MRRPGLWGISPPQLRAVSAPGGLPGPARVRGALSAALWGQGRAPGQYDMLDVLGLND